MPPDLIIYAIVAAGLVLWLRSVLGTRHGEERERPNPLAPNQQDGITETLLKIEKIVVGGMEERINALFQNPEPVKQIENKTAEAGLIEIAKADKNFDIDFFLDGAQDAFAMIIESFAEGDRGALRALLAPPVYDAFEGAITAREARKETQISEIHAIRKAEIIEAHLKGRDAVIVIRFVADETSVGRDELGNILYGNPDKPMPMKDIWVFGRDIKSKDPAWVVRETRGDFADDNQTIPNSH